MISMADPEHPADKPAAEQPAAESASERRGRERHEISGLGVVLFRSREARGTTRAINVSLGGILLESEFSWPAIGSPVELTFSMEEHGLMFSVPGHIVRHVGEARAAVQFHEESEKLRSVIQKALGTPE